MTGSLELRRLLGGSVHVESMPEVIRLRTRVSYFFVGLMWLHVPLVAAMAAHLGTSFAMQLSIASGRR